MSFLQQCRQQNLISGPALDKLILFADLILEWNPRINLTGFKSRNLVEELLLGEAVLALARLSPSGKRILDFGSGAGIPGLVWAICEPEMHLTSVEVRAKKVAFQKEVVRSTGLKAQILVGRFPQAVRGRSFDLIVSRAIRFDPSLWREAEMLLSEDGMLVRFAAAGAAEPEWNCIPISTRSSLLIRTP